MIKAIEMRNVKGQTAVQPLTGKDIIIGRNGAGKTTRMQTIGLAMLGYVPGKGKTVGDTFKLASDDEMMVGLETENFSFSRTFTKTRKMNKLGETEVKISQKVAVSPSMGESTIAKKEVRIQQEIGNFPVMLDFGSFIAMTDNQKRDFIYNLSGNGFTWDRNRVESELKAAVLNPGMEENNKELYDLMVENIEDTMKQYRESMDIQLGILAMSEYAKDRLKHWKKEKITADGAAKKLTELKNRGAETDRDLAINQDRMKKLQEKKEQLIKDIAEISAKNKVLDEKEIQKNTLREEIDHLEEHSDITEESKRLTEAIAELESAIGESDNTEKEFDVKETDIQNHMAMHQNAIKTETDKLVALKDELAIINAEIKANSELLKRISDSHGFCAFSPNIPCNQDFSGFIEETNGIMDSAYDKKDEVESSISVVLKSIDEYEKEYQRACDERTLLDTERKTYRKTIEKNRKLLDKNKSELNDLQSRDTRLAAKRQQFEEISSYLNENQKVDLTAMEDQKILLEGQIQSLTVKIDEQKKVRNDLLNIKANIIDSQTAEYNVLSWKYIDEAIGQKGIKGSIMKEMLSPLMEEVDTKLQEIGICEKFFFETSSDTGKEIFEFGWGDRPFDALSTGEQLLLMTALMTTMIEKSGSPVKVLAIDNVNDLDKHNLSLVINGLNTIGKNMDNIILAGVVEPTEEDSEGWTVWRL